MVETQTTEEALLHRVAENIGKRRRALGLTQAQLAERLGVDTETLSRFERGKHSPTLKNLARLAGLLQTTVSDLLAEERQQPSDNSTIISAWLDVLPSADQAFAMAMLKQCCDYLGSRKGVAVPITEPQAGDKRNPQEREEALQMTSEAADGSVVSLREDDEPATPRRSGLPTRMGIFRVDMIVELGQLRERLDEVLKVLDEKGVVRLERNSQSLARVNLATVYKLYRYAPEVREVIVSRYPDCIAQEKEDKKKEKADRKQEEEDLRSSRPRQVRTVSVKKKKKAVPESWDATVEEDQEFSSGIENKSSQED
jgi:transcriptional regulator with XRE-family HTH domain